MWKKIIFLPLLFLLPFSVFSQENKIQKKIKENMERYQKNKQEKIAQGKPWIDPFVGPGYSPDAGFVLAGGALLTFKTNAKDTLIQRSSLPFTFIYGTRGSLKFSSNLNSFWLNDKLRINTEVFIKKAIEDYWGVGYETASQLVQSDSTTRYENNAFKISPVILGRIVPNLFAGVILDFNQVNVLKTNPIMAQDPDFLEYGPRNFNTGIGLTVQYDSRDITVNAWKGLYLKLGGIWYDHFLGGDNKYQLVDVDLRHYRMLDRPGKTIAFLLRGEFGFGEVPYTELSRLGGARNLRGYPLDQYRNKNGVVFITEYRHMFLKQDKTLSKSGIVFWAGTGTITSTEDPRNWLPNFGVGYRLELQPRMNLRLDFGIGRETSGLYFNFNEAF